jgi:hypothetical protein
MEIAVKVLLSFLVSTLWRLFHLSERLGTDDDIAVNAVRDLWKKEKRETLPRGYVRRQLLRESITAIAVAGLLSLSLIGLSAVVPKNASADVFDSQTDAAPHVTDQPRCSPEALLGSYVGDVGGATTVLRIVRVNTTTGETAHISYSLVANRREVKRDDGVIRFSDCSVVIPALRPLDGRFRVAGPVATITALEPVWTLERR